MTPAERSGYVAAQQKKRQALQSTIARLHQERERFVKDKLKNQAAASTLDAAIIKALRSQAAEKKFSFDK